MQNVTNYNNYKDYLKDVYLAKTTEKRGFSFTVWAKSLGISSPSTLSMVINGNRHPSKNLTKKLSNYLNHTDEEYNHFENIISLQKAKLNPHLTIHLNSKTNKNEPTSAFDISTFIIRELLNNRETKDPVAFIKANIKQDITTEEIQAKLEILFSKKLLEKKDHFYYAIGNIMEEVVSSKETIFGFHSSTMEYSKTAFNKTKIEERSFNTSILSVKKEKISEAKELIKEFQHKMTNLLEDEEQSGDQIYLFNMNLFPVTDKI